jgi:hypothetical protein
MVSPVVHMACGANNASFALITIPLISQLSFTKKVIHWLPRAIVAVLHHAPIGMIAMGGLVAPIANIFNLIQ